MADISEWSPVDESNNQPPPNGWPEGMAPSAVNNSARAIMGAVRRHHDQIVSGSLGLPYLPLSGGSLSGSIIVAGNVQASGTVTAAQLTSTANITATGTVTAAQLTSTANITATGTVVAGAVSASGNITAAGTVTANHLTSNADINADGNIDCAGTLTSNAINGGTVHAYETLSSGTSVAAPVIAASGALSGNTIASASWMDAAQYRLSGVPIEFGTLFSELADLRERVRALEERP